MEDVELYLDAVFRALEARERRHILTYLQEDTDHTASLDDIADYLAGEMNDDPDRLLAGLIHSHLPRLEEQGWIEYDARSAQVRDDILEVDAKDRILLDYLADVSDQDDDYLDNVFSGLASAERRRTLYVLEEQQDGYSTVKGLAPYLVNDSDTDEPDRDMIDETELERATIALYHKILPKLAESGWIDYSEESQKVSLKLRVPSDYLDRVYAES